VTSVFWFRPFATQEMDHDRLEAIIRTNAIPSEAEDHHIRALISQCEANLSNIDNEMSCLSERRKMCLGQMYAYHAAFSHARRLPPEIVAKIFLLAQSPQHMTNSTFTSICSAWRNVAISTPALWNRVDIQSSKRKPSKQAALLKIHCERARALPIDVFFHSWMAAAALKGEPSPIVALLPYVKNIRTLNLWVPSKWLEVLLGLPEESFRSLEDFSAKLCGQSTITQDLRPTLTLTSAHHLRSLKIEGFSLVLRIPSQLSNLTLDLDLTPAEYLGVLCNCPNLETLGLTFSSSADDMESDKTILLPLLRSLSLRIPVDCSYNTFLDHITLSLLTDLDICYDDLEQPWPQSSFLSLLSRSSCHLERLTLDKVEMTSEEFYECLRAMPSLVYLDLNFIYVMEDWILDELVNGGAASPLLPNLQIFHLFPLEFSHRFSDESFANMVESRWWPDDSIQGVNSPLRSVPRLRAVSVQSDCRRETPVDESILQRLRRCREEGLTITFDGLSR
jgi:hypothetical protein